MEIGTIQIDAEAHTVTARVPLPPGAALPLYGLRVGRLVACDEGPDGVTFTYAAEPGRPPRFRPFAELRDATPLALPAL
jgi:hypothetical protein